MSSVADLLNSVWGFMNERARKSGEAARAATGINDEDGVLDIVRKTAQADVVPESQRIATIAIPEIGTSFAAAVPNLYGLVNAGVSKATGGEFLSTMITGKPSGGTQLPGAEDAVNLARAIKAPTTELSEAVVGKPVEDRLLDGTMNDLVGSWSRLILGAGATLPVALPRVTSGIKVLDEAGNALIRTAELVTPVTVAKNPTVGLVNTNVGIAAGLGAGIEHAIDQNFPKVAQGSEPQQPNIADNAKANSDQFAKGAQDVAAQGIDEAKASPTPVQAGLSTGNTWADLGLGAALGAAAVYSYWKRGVAYRAVTGLDKGDVSHQSPSTIAAEILSDSNAPIAAVERERLGVPNSWIGTDYREAGNVRRGNGMTNEQARAAADAFESRLAERTGASIETKVNGQLLQFGEFPDSTIRITPWNERMTQLKSMDESQQAAVERLLNIRHELDTRQVLAKEAFGNLYMGRAGTPTADHILRQIVNHYQWDDTKVAYNMFGERTKDLLAAWDARNADPVVARYVDSVFADFNKAVDYLYEQRRITQQERVNFNRINPHYVATELSSGKSHLGERQPAPMSGLENPGSPLAHYPKYFTEIVREVEKTKMMRDALGPLIQAKQYGDPIANKYIGRIESGLRNSSNASHLAVTFRNERGMPVTVEIKDPIYRRALRSMDNPSRLTMMGAAMKVLTMPARFFESSATGSLGAITGSIFAPVGAVYSAGVAMATRDRALGNVGWIDKYLRDKGFKYGLRGDPTFLADMAYRMGGNILAVFAQRGAQTLKESMAMNGYLNRALTPAAMNHYANVMEQYFKRSAVYELQTRAQMGPASMGAVDPAKRIKDVGDYLNSQKSVWGKVVAKPEAFGRFIGDILHAISVGPSASVLAMNKGGNKAHVNKLLREMSGDPSRVGSFAGPLGQVAGFGTATSPWGNIFIQGNRKLVTAFRKDPIATTMGVVNTAVIPTMLATMYAASLGEEYTNYQYHVRPPDRQAGYVYIPIPGLPPHMGIEFPVEPTLRLYKWGGEAIAAAYLGLLDGSFFKEENSDMQRALADVTNFRMFGASGAGAFSFDEKTVPNSIMNSVYMPPTNPLISAGAAAAGIRLRGYGDATPIRENNHGFTTAKGPSPLRPWEDAETQAIINALGTTSAVWVYNTIADAVTGKKLGQSTGEVATQAGKSYVQRAKDSASAKMVGSSALFENFQSLSPGTEASGVLVRQKIDGIKRFTEAYQKVTDKGVPLGNFVGNPRQGYQPSQGVGPVTPEDQRILGLAFVLNRASPNMEKEFLGATRILYDERNRISAAPDLSPEQKRAKMNSYALDIIETNRRLLQRLTLMESNLSKQYGMPIKFENLKLGKSFEELATK